MFQLRRWWHIGAWLLSGWLLAMALSIGLGTLPGLSQAFPGASSPLTLAQLTQQGVDQYQAGQFGAAIALWQQALNQTTDPTDRAILFANLAQAYQQIGKADQAIAQWEQAIAIYRTQPAQSTLLAQALTEQAQSYSELGQQERAIELLQDAIALVKQNPRILSAAQGALGNAHLALGNYESAETALLTSLKLAEDQQLGSTIPPILNNLGNLYTSRAQRYQAQAIAAQAEGEDSEAQRLMQWATEDRTAAQAIYNQSALASRQLDPLAEVKALLNLNHLLQQAPTPDIALMNGNRDRLLTLLSQIPASQDKVYALINLSTQPNTDSTQALKLLQQAIAEAKSLQNLRAESYALGSLGALYESTQQYRTALAWTQQAQFAAQQINAADSLYRWQWQAGRILAQTGHSEQAIPVYEQAIATLQTIRGDIVAANRELQFNFRDSVEPVYRELIGLLLPAAPTAAPKALDAVAPAQINQALNLLELLKLAELQNFFGDECVQVAQTNAQKSEAKTDPTAATIYSVVLRDRTELILRLPGGQLSRYSVPLGQDGMQREIDQLRSLLEKRATDEYLTQAQKVYQLLMQPLAADLAAAQPKTLVFIQDGVLRNVPMAALYDGQEFLVQKYAIANTPSLSLTAIQSSRTAAPQALIAGLTIERPPFAALTNVAKETQEVKNILGGTLLLDQDFTLARLKEKIKTGNYSILHLATHGKFGVDNDSTFLLGFDSRITIDQLDSLLRLRQNHQPVDLLTLSACQTAAGDNRSALGIAGVAVRAGVRSALASLWFINDEATLPLIEEFYTQVRQPGMTKAEALRRSQLKMLANPELAHPAVWSPLILIGNWL